MEILVFSSLFFTGSASEIFIPSFFNSPKATYINTDITNKIPLIRNKNIVALWDDHTSQMDRLKFSQKHDIKYMSTQMLSLHTILL